MPVNLSSTSTIYKLWPSLLQILCSTNCTRVLVFLLIYIVTDNHILTFDDFRSTIVCDQCHQIVAEDEVRMRVIRKVIGYIVLS